jgi:hypothetical protein
MTAQVTLGLQQSVLERFTIKMVLKPEGQKYKKKTIKKI